MNYGDIEITTTELPEGVLILILAQSILPFPMLKNSLPQLVEV